MKIRDGYETVVVLSAMANSRSAFYVQFVATAAGFLVSAYLVSTVLFDFGPAQDISPALRVFVGLFALGVAIAVVFSMIWYSTRGYRGWKIEGSELVLLDKAGQEAARIALAEVSKAQAQADDWELLKHAEGDELAEPAPETQPHEGELEIEAGGKRYLVITESSAKAKEAAAAIEKARGK